MNKNLYYIVSSLFLFNNEIVSAIAVLILLVMGMVHFATLAEAEKRRGKEE